MMVSKISSFLSTLLMDNQTADTNGEDYSWDAIWKSKAIITWVGGRNENTLCCSAFLQKNKLGS
jgi:hypothetical protein